MKTKFEQYIKALATAACGLLVLMALTVMVGCATKPIPDQCRNALTVIRGYEIYLKTLPAGEKPSEQQTAIFNAAVLIWDLQCGTLPEQSEQSRALQAVLPPPQPKTLTVKGSKFVLVIPWNAKGDSGPIYRARPDDGWRYIPDTAYLKRKSNRPVEMLRVWWPHSN